MMKITIDFDADDSKLVDSVFTNYGYDTLEKKQEKIKQLTFDWAQKWLYEMARHAKDKAHPE